MRRARTAAAVAAAALAASTLAAHATAAGPDTARGGGRPNVLVIFTDDQRADEMRWMPRTRRLIGGAQGTTYTTALSENPLCCPFRAALLTGQYTHNNGVLGNSLAANGGYWRFDQQHNLAPALHDRGYRTGWYGKFLNGYESGVPDGRTHVPPGWDEWHAPVRGLPNYGNTQINHNGRLRWHRGYATDIYARQSSAMIHRLAAGSQPFLGFITYYAPHEGWVGRPDPDSNYAAPRHRGTLKGRMPARMPGAFGERDMSDKPDYMPRTFTREKRRRMRLIRRIRAESLLSADEAVARNLRALRRTGELADTVVIFMSDNGYLLGEHRKAGKIVPYEESIRVPLLIRGPGFAAGNSNRSLVGAVDVAATIADVANAEDRVRRDYPIDGRSLAGRPRLPDVPILIEAGGQHLPPGSTRLRHYTGVRTRRFMYAQYWTDEEELYDLRADPEQRRSLDADPASTDVLQRLRAETRAREDCTGTACR